MEHPRLRSEYTAAARTRERPRCDGRPWQSDPLGFKGTGLPHHRGAGVSDRVATPDGVVRRDSVLPGPSSESKKRGQVEVAHWFRQNMFHFLSGASQWAGYAAVNHMGRLPKHTPSGVRPSQGGRTVHILLARPRRRVIPRSWPLAVSIQWTFISGVRIRSALAPHRLSALPRCRPTLFQFPPGRARHWKKRAAGGSSDPVQEGHGTSWLRGLICLLDA